MAKHKLKLISYGFTISKLKSRKEKDLTTFLEFYKTFVTDDDDGFPSTNELFQRFFKDLIKQFDEGFIENKEATKAFRVINEGFDLSFSQQYFDGLFEGGLTNIEQNIATKNNKNRRRVGPEDVLVLPYYMFFSAPEDRNWGILMVQFYDSNTINSPIRDFLIQYFNKKGFKIEFGSMVSKEDREKFLNKSEVYKISYTDVLKREFPGNEFDELVGETNYINVNVYITGVKGKPKEFVRRVKGNIRDFFRLDVKGAIKLKERPSKIFYSNEDGRSHAEIDNYDHLYPTKILVDSLKEEGKHSPDLVKIREFCRSYWRVLVSERSK